MGSPRAELGRTGQFLLEGMGRLEVKDSWGVEHAGSLLPSALFPGSCPLTPSHSCSFCLVPTSPHP